MNYSQGDTADDRAAEPPGVHRSTEGWCTKPRQGVDGETRCVDHRAQKPWKNCRGITGS